MSAALKLAGTVTVPLRDAIDGYLRQIAATGLSAGTVRKYRDTLRRLQGDLGPGTDVAAITGGDLLGWVTRAWDESSPATWNAGRAALTGAWEHWTASGLVPLNAARGIPRRKVPPHAPKAISPEAISGLLHLDGAALRERAFWAVLYATGARISEILGLDIEDIDRASRTATVTRKGGWRDTVAYDSLAARLLGRYIGQRKRGPVFLTTRRAPEGTPLGDLSPDGRARLGYHQARRLLEDGARRATCGHVTPHQIRHSRGTHARQSGADIELVRAMLGHKDVRTTRIYADTGITQVAAWVAQDDAKRRKAGL